MAMMSTSVRKTPKESKREEWKHVALPARLSQGGDAVTTSVSESASVSTLVQRFEALANQAQHATHLHSLPDVDKVRIRLPDHVGEIVDQWEQMTAETSSFSSGETSSISSGETSSISSGETSSISSADSVVTVIAAPQKPPCTRLQSDTAETTGTTPTPPPKPARCKDFVLYRNTLGQFGVSLMPTEISERSFSGSTEQSMRRIHVVCQAADSDASLPVGRLVAVNFLPVHDITTADLYTIIARSAESVRLRIQPLDFPQSVLQTLVYSEQHRVAQENDSQGQSHPLGIKVLVKRKMKRVIQRCREAVGSCCEQLKSCVSGV
ncbi:uncharacterized protein LOC118422543 [Branchiostoma floridae]|uniref:Uncharacterized protein LOC118422543 n=1 Tax=Branchiostoma floridae TaxID=7739 RepID=A0A9J7LP06_BRAFL|nr:uncharacterized protein LOC118422543 [Branchiostoma floridae]